MFLAFFFKNLISTKLYIIHPIKIKLHSLHRHSSFGFNTALRQIGGLSSRYLTIFKKNHQQHIRTLSTTQLCKNFLTLDSINPNVKNMEYVVQSPLMIRAREIDKELCQVSSYIKNRFCETEGKVVLLFSAKQKL